MRYSRVVLPILLALFASQAHAADLWRPKGQPIFLDTNGEPLAGAKLCFYSAGTTNQKTVYKGADELSVWSQPITLNSAGALTDSIYVPTGPFKEVLQSANATTCVGGGDGTVLTTTDSIPGAFDAAALNVEFAKPDTPVIAKASNYVVTTSDLGKVINCDATGGNVTLTLPSAVTAGDGAQVTARKTDSSSNTCSFATVASQTINGAASLALSFQHDGATITSDGSTWGITAKAFNTLRAASIADATLTFGKIATSAYSTSSTLAENSDTLFATQKATKSYVDTAVTSGVKWKDPVRVASTADVATATGLENGDTIDGVVLATNDRVLLKNQSTPAQNGIYVAVASGAASRSTDADAASEINGATVFVSAGAANTGRQYTQSATVVTLGTDTVTWALISAGQSYTAGTGLDLAGSEFSVEPGGVGTTQIATDGVGSDEIAANAVGSSEIAADAVGASEIASGAVDTTELSATVTGKLTQSFVVAASDESTALTTGTAKVVWRMPYAFTVTGVRCSLTTAQTAGSIFTVDINEGGTTILSTKVTIDNNEETSTTAVTAPVISDSALADDSEMTIDIDQIGTSGAKGLKCAIIGSKT